MIKKKCPNCQSENISNAKYCSGCGYELPKDQEDMTAESKQSISVPALAEGKKRESKKRLMGEYSV